MAYSSLTRRKFLGAAAVGGAFTLTTGPAIAQTQGAGLLAKLRKAGVVKISMTNGAPYGILLPDGTVSGVSPTIVRIIMERLGIPKVEGIITTYGQMIPGLMAGRWDMIGAPMNITGERCKQVMYADPILYEGSGYAYIPANLPDPPKSLEEVGQRIKKIGAQAGSTSQIILTPIMAAGNKGEVLMFPDTAALMEGLNTKRVEMIVTGIVSLHDLKKEGKGGPFEIVYPMKGDPLKGAAPGFRFEDTDLYEAFQTEYRKMKKSGEAEKIITGFGFDILPGWAELTGEKACTLA